MFPSMQIIWLKHEDAVLILDGIDCLDSLEIIVGKFSVY